MTNEEKSIITSIKNGDLKTSYGLLEMNRSFLRGLYNKLYICGYYYEEFESLCYVALLKAANKADISKLEYFNGYWKKYILHEYLVEKIQVQYAFSMNTALYQKLRQSNTDVITDYYSTLEYEGLIIDGCYEDLYHKELRRILWVEVQNVLTETNAYIIWSIYSNHRTMVSLAKELGIGVERVRRRKVRSLEKLRNSAIIKSLGRDYYLLDVD